MKSFSSKRQWIALVVFVLLVLFVLRPGASRLKSRIISSISAGVGRPVDIGSVHLRLLPRPGFDIESLVIYDDPTYGAEPMLRAGEVTADLRILSLMKGRIEISRMDLTEPSLNLVHRTGGDWNLQALLERTAHNVTAPTGPRKAAPLPQFPYIEGSSGRINLKTGAEKRPYALINADFSLWQESEDTWGVRLKAQPFRTDLNLTDVGQLQISGTWKRAPSFEETPLELDAEWSKAQLGQLTKLFTGADKGWRGNIQLDAKLSGTPAKLRIASTASMDDFRRYDITSGNALRLGARCDGEYSSLTHEFHEVICSAPVGDGGLTLTGDLGLPGSGHYSISLKAENIPASAVAGLVERAKKNIPEDLVAAGTLRGTATIEHATATDPLASFRGSGEIADFRLNSANNKLDLGPTTVPFQLVDDSVKVRDRIQNGHAGVQFPKGPHIEIGPILLSAGHNGTPTLRGWLNRTSYSFAVAGETEIAKALRMARGVGLPVAAVNAEGSTQLNLQIAGSWVGLGGELGIGFPAPEVTGMARLRNVRVAVSGAGEPLEIASAEILLAPDKVHVSKLNANALGALWSGSLEMPRGCGTPEACSVRFTLSTQELALSRMGEWVHGRQKSRPWYRALEPATRLGQSFLGKVHASGEVSANRFILHGIQASNASAKVRIDSGKLELSALNADLLNGKHRGKWNIEFDGASAACSGSGSVSGIVLGKLDAVQNSWLTGTASGSYEISGSCSAEFWQAAEGKFQAEVRNGTLPRVLIGDEPSPLVFTKFSGQALLSSGNFELSSAKLFAPAGAYDLTGSVTLKRDVDVKMTRVPADATHIGYTVTGTLASPHVSPLGSTEQAKLKAIPTK